MLETTYYLLSAFAVIFVFFILFKAEKSTTSHHKLSGLVLSFSAAWLLYCFALIESGTLLDYSLPPKFPLLIILPFSIACVFLYRLVKKSAVIETVKMEYLVLFQGFRIAVEIMLYYTFVIGVIPETATFDGYNFDMIMGISAPLLFLLMKRGKVSNFFLKIWNIFGIVMILFVAIIIGSSMYFPQLWDYKSIVSEDFLSFPYFLIAACIAPWAIAVHVIALAKLSKKKSRLISESGF